jgi:hypothetical protein
VWIDLATISLANQPEHIGNVHQNVLLDYLEKQATCENASKPSQEFPSIISDAANCLPNRQSGDAVSEECSPKRRDKLLNSGFEKVNEPERYLDGSEASKPSPIAALCESLLAQTTWDSHRNLQNGSFGESSPMPIFSARSGSVNSCKGLLELHQTVIRSTSIVPTIHTRYIAV